MTETILAMLIAIRVVESTNGLDPKALGNDYQITKVCVQDVNRIYGTRYRYPQCTRNREDAENIVLLYLTYYGMKFKKRTGRVPTTEDLARIYNAGPTGAARGRGHAYAEKVRRAMPKR